MKMRLFSSFILSLCSVMAFSQTILYQAETTTRTVQDPQTVVLAQGFQASGSVSNPFVAKIGPGTENPGGGPTDSNAGVNNPSGAITSSADQKFYDTSGNIEVNGAGQLQFTLPILLPAGTKNVEPKISLIYTSGAGNGVSGYGWNISGITSISRVGRNIEKDGDTKAVQFDYSDYYSFNGQRLILKSGEYGKDGAEYVTEKYSNVKIKSVGTYPINGQNAGPAHFEITFEDGSQAWYGAYVGGTRGNTTITTPLEYNIVKWRDTQGNYISYNYEYAGSTGGFRSPINVLRVSSIAWGGNEVLSKPHYNNIEFIYINRDLKELSHVQGLDFLQDKILSEVRITSSLQLMKRYTVTYKKNTNGSDYQFVDKITEYNSANEAANPIVFDYEKSTLGGWKSTQYDYTEDHKVLGDFDGDGKVDMLKYSNSVNYCKKYNTQPPINPSANENEISYTDYSDSKCIEWVNELGGFFVFKNIFDDNKPDKIAVTADLVKEDLDNASAIVVKDNNNIVSSKQSLVVFRKNKIAGTEKADLEFKIFTFSDNNTLDFQYSKTIQYTQYATDQNSTVENQIKQVDLNGDGLSEIIVTVKNANNIYKYLRVSLNKDVPNSNSFVSFDLSPNNSPAMSNYMMGDFDGDSKTDFLRLNNNIATFVNLQDNGQSITVTETAAQNNLGAMSFSGIWASSVLGDYNGDGKTDLLIPTAFNSSDWRMYSSTGKGFTEKYYSNFCYFQESQNDPDNYIPWYSFRRTYLAQDLNKDGKSDFIEFFSLVQINQTGAAQSRFLVNLHENKGYSSASQKVEFQKKKLINYNSSSASVNFPLIENYRGYPYWYNTNNTYYRTSMEELTWSSVAEHYTPIFGNFRINMSDENILVFQKSKLFKFNYYDISKEARIKTITKGNITTEVEYKELDPSIDSNFYKPVKKEQYPYMETNKVYQTSVVFQLRSSGRKQDFRYRGFISHLEGKGMIGFRQTARSSWYADDFENTKVWSGSEMDPLNDGVPIKEWSIRTNDESMIFPADLSVNNNQLLTFKSIIYKTDKLLNGQVVTVISPADKSKIVTAIVIQSMRTKDFLTNITTDTDITYGNYYLPSSTATSNGFTIDGNSFSYINNPNGIGPDYYIGRPASKSTSRFISSYSNVVVSKEDYAYDNNLLKTLKTWNRDETGYKLETYNYDGFGNIADKIITNSVDSQSETAGSEYDAKGRFVIKKIDNLGLETNFTYDDFGKILTQTDTFGNTINNTYDAWGTLIKTKSNLSGTTSYQHFRDNNGNVTITQYDPDGNISRQFINKLGQKYKTQKKGFNQNTFIATYSVYDILGRKIRESEPYIDVAAEESQFPASLRWNVITYDDTVYPTKVTNTALAKIDNSGLITSFIGKKVETSIAGLTTTVKEINGYARIYSKTTDPLGNIISSTDKGGTITFLYNAAGEQTQAKYGENTVTTKYDAWGRRSEFNDPSNGLYKYEYDGLGKLKKVISPKGTKEYTYDIQGLLISQKELSTADGGQATNKTITYLYDNKGRVISKSGTSNGRSFSSSVLFDPQGRILSSSESNNGKYYIQKGITYDDKARIISYEKSVYSSGIQTKVVIENIYSSWNGELSQIKDKTSGKVLWTLVETNEKGQALKANLGKSRIFNTYDESGYLSSIDHQHWFQLQGDPSILLINYTFDNVKNELKTRNRLGDFNIYEFFTYDDNNRLINWTNPRTGQLSQNIYDTKGRILENDQVGTIKYNNSGKVYQPSGMTLNTAGTQNYNNDLIQTIIYNENNDPVFIDGEKGDVAFQYGLTNMRQRATYGGNFGEDGEGKFTKFYSHDGSFEILKDNTTGKEKHILYIGGIPYESNILFIKNYNDANGSYKFLHKDYIGSILAISDEDGSTLEQRHFDAWGNFTHLKITTGSVITDKNAIDNAFLLVDRGYTSHEHFAEVGIIHMNGRLYDPLLRRFLNADENIQDPYNTQNYNKYGYVLNNPLMFNDPTGEYWEAGVFLTVAAVMIKGAIIGAAIAAAFYLAKAYLTRSFSVSGFLKSITIGAITGAVSSGLGQVFSAGSFLATVGNGILSGAGSSAVQSLINGTNVLEGITKGAIIGGTFAALTYTVSYLLTKPEMSYMEVKDENTLAGGEPTPVGDRVYARKLYESQFKQNPHLESRNIYNRANPGGYMGKDGYIHTKIDGKNATLWGSTKVGKDFMSGKMVSKVYLSHNAFNSREQLATVLQHELNHVNIDWTTLEGAAHIPISFKKDDAGYPYRESLNNVGHYYIEESSTNFIINNKWTNMIEHIPERVWNHIWFRDLNEAVQKIIQGTDKAININFIK